MSATGVKIKEKGHPERGLPPTVRDKVRQVSTRGQTHVSYKSPREDANKAAKAQAS